MENRHRFAQAAAPADPVETADVAAAIGTDERRMHVRAYNYWVSLLDGRDFPAITDLDPTDLKDFGPHSLLLDFSSDPDNPALPFIGTAIRSECDLVDGMTRIADVPGRSLISRLTDHYMQIVANRAPVGFEAEFVNQRGHTIFYRGIMMPLSSDGRTIDFIYGVINWKDGGAPQAAAAVLRPALPPIAATDAAAAPAVPEARSEAGGDEDGCASDAALAVDWDGAQGDGEPEFDADAIPQLDDDAGLADRLWAARESAEVCKAADGRSRAALYRALAMAYDFAIATRRVPDDYLEILEDSGVKAQARAPMTPIVKLVFGIDYDKTRLTEFAAALSHAERAGVDFGEFQAFIEATDGGLKGLVAAERKARRPDGPPVDRRAFAAAALRRRDAIPLAQLPTNEEFAVVVTRRNADGRHEVVAMVQDEALIERAMIRATRR